MLYGMLGENSKVEQFVNLILENRSSPNNKVGFSLLADPRSRLERPYFQVNGCRYGMR